MIGWACFKLNNDPGTRENLSRALFFDATTCRESFLPAEPFLETLNALKQQYAEPDPAWIRLPVELWTAEEIDVSRDEQYLLRLREKIARPPEPSGRDAVGCGLLFNRLRCLAEILRCTRANYNEMVAVRGQMKALDAQQFEEYREGVASRKGDSAF